ncbi:MAG: efflux RND transporter periplasmic adaptor subunit [Aromatoleum sp.]|nr:efflux RND transporter periplasmic adaptor subunit [Aromatoleum sp.]
MNKAVVGAIIALGLALTAAGGYWLGQKRASAPVDSSASGVAAGVQGKGIGGAAVTQNAPASVAVEAVKAVMKPLPKSITAVGSLRSDESITVRPEVAGRISAILFQEGQRVVKGSTLIKLDPAINAAEVQQARANLTLAKSKFDRAVDLAKSNFISGQAKDEAENNLRVAEAAVALAQARLAKTEIQAPFSGIIGLRVVSVGDYVKEGADVVNLESIDPLKVDFRIPETFLRQVQVGQSLQVALDALPGKSFEGKVFAVNPLVDAGGRAIVIRAVVRNPDTSLRPGMFARVRLITGDQKDALVVPEQAIVPQGDEQFVFRVVDGTAARVKVEVGQRRDGKVEIVKGLAPDDMVVIAGQLKIRDGTAVAVSAGTPGVSEANSATLPAPAAVAASPRAPANGGVRAKAENTPPTAPKS